jgi:hypothetical protein
MQYDYFEKQKIVYHFGLETYGHLKKYSDILCISNISTINIFFYNDRIVFRSIKRDSSNYNISFDLFIYKKYLLNFYVSETEFKKTEKNYLFKKQMSSQNFKQILSSNDSKTNSISFYVVKKEEGEEGEEEDINNKYELKINVGSSSHSIEKIKDHTRNIFFNEEEDYEENFFSSEKLKEWNFGIVKCDSSTIQPIFKKNKVSYDNIVIKVGYNLLVEFYSDSSKTCKEKSPLTGFLSTACFNKEELDVEFNKTTLNSSILEILKKFFSFKEEANCIISSKKDGYLTFLRPIDSTSELIINISNTKNT